MIKINVIINNIDWYKFIKNPSYYIDKKMNKFNTKNKKFTKKNIFCTLLLSGDKEIKYLNKKFRKKSKSTDVLSFPFHTKKDLKKKLLKEKEIYLGDIIVNLNKEDDYSKKKENDNEILNTNNSREKQVITVDISSDEKIVYSLIF